MEPTQPPHLPSPPPRQEPSIPYWQQPQYRQSRIWGDIAPTFWERQMAVYRHDLHQWAKRLNVSVGGLLALLTVVACMCCFVWSLIGLSFVVHPDSQAGAQDAQTDYAATLNAAASAAAATVGPTATAGPTATPVPTETPLQQLQWIVRVAATPDYTRDVSFQGGMVIVNETIGASDSVTADTCKTEIFNIQKAIWQQWASIGHPREVNVNIIGPLQDKYGRVYNGPYAHTTIVASSAQKYVWANLDAQSAWYAYDEASIRSDL